MKHLMLVFCVGVSFISCTNDDEPSNRDLLNGRHWILKEVDSGPFGYCRDLFVASDFSLDKTYESISEDSRDIILWMLFLTIPYLLHFSLQFTLRPEYSDDEKLPSTLPNVIPIYFHNAK